MNEQEKRELMLKAAVQFNGVWPNDVTEILIFTSECGLISQAICLDSIVGMGFNQLCTRAEFEAFIDSLFVGAPYDAEYYSAPTIEHFEAWYKFDGEKWVVYCPDGNIYIWEEIVEKVDPKSLIPRPRKQEVAKCEHCKVYEEFGNAMFESGYIEKQEQLNAKLKQDIDAILWNGEGLPPVGVECEYSKGDDKWHVCKVLMYGHHTAFIRSHKADENDLKEYSVPLFDVEFRLLKTEAEKERERLTSEAIEIALGVLRVTDKKTIAPIEIADAFIDAGWRPSKD